ncbi:MAG: hypothetical protein J6K48_13475 [Lachnospiraceae bacterium]|nr:hypothetical protein [Lachnospiraceae bacterium]
MNISWNQTYGVLQRVNSFGMLQSTQSKLERQQETQNQVEFYEQQKENLKNVTCETVEEIAEKLKHLHSYNEQIAAVKAAYNNEQMFHILDESTERGEKIAEAAEKMEPKTPEERREELIEEALGIEKPDGALGEVMDEMEEVVKEMTEHVAEEMTETLDEAVSEQADVETAESLDEEA